MNKQRLKLLADKLRLIPEIKFGIDNWRCYTNRKVQNLGVTNEDLRDPACKTTGCAIGHACLMPEFRALGLSWQEVYPVLKLGDKEYKQVNAVLALFALTFDEYHQMFTRYGYNYNGKATPTDVANKIESMIA